MKQIYKILFVFVLFFSGCENNKIDSDIFSKGTEMSQEAKELAKHLDKESYKDLADLFLDTSKIDFSKDVFIIFGKNQCKYCDMLKNEIKKSTDLQNTIKTHFNPYYINISYDKVHTITPNSPCKLDLPLDSKLDSTKGAESCDKNAESATKSTKQIDTENLARIFGVSSTPLIAFLDKDMRIKYIYPGFSLKLQKMVDDIISNAIIAGDYEDINRALNAL